MLASTQASRLTSTTGREERYRQVPARYLSVSLSVLLVFIFFPRFSRPCLLASPCSLFRPEAPHCLATLHSARRPNAFPSPSPSFAMSLIEHHNEIVRHALVKDVAIICDDPTKARLSAALLKHDAFRSAKAKVSCLIDIELVATFFFEREKEKPHGSVF